MAAAADNDESLLRALNHPTRRKVLRHMRHSGGAVSPRRLSEVMGEPLSNISYHVRVLFESEAISLSGTAPVRGTTEHFYIFDITEPWALAVLGVTAIGSDGVTKDAG